MRILKIYNVLAVLIFSNTYGEAQTYVIQDTSICEGVGINIGKPGSDPNLCYKWDEDPSFVNQDYNNPNPMVKPTDTTTYRLTVTGNNFSTRQVESVTVNVGLGGIVSTPSYTQPDGTQQQIICHVTTRRPMTSLEWDIPDAGMSGCAIHPMNGVIGGCEVPGTYTVKIFEVGNESCFAEKKFEVNVGVKDVFAFDAADPTRFAKTGEKLWLVGRNAVNFKAIPNQGFQFDFIEQPKWEEPVNPFPSVVAEWTHDEATPLEFTATAGGKSVEIEKQDVGDVSANPTGALGALLNVVKDLVKPPNESQSNSGAVDDAVEAFCLPADFQIMPSLVYKTEPVNRWHSPLTGTKKSLTGALTGEFTGKVCLPPPYSNNLYAMKWSTYFFFTGSVAIAGNIAKDESTAYPAEWKVNGLDASGGLTIGIRGEVVVTIPGDLFAVQGALTGAVGLTVDPTFDFGNSRILAKATVAPFYIDANLKVWYLNPNNTLINLSGRYNVMDPISTDNKLIYQFD